MNSEKLAGKIKWQLKANPTVLNLNGENLSDEHVRIIVEHQKNTPSIRVLSLNDNQIGAEGFAALEELVKSSPSLLSLDAKGNTAGEKAEKKLANAVLKSHSIIEADIPITHNFIGDNRGKIDSHCKNNAKEAREIIEMIVKYPEAAQKKDFEDIRNRIGAVTFLAWSDGVDTGENSVFAQNLAKLQEKAKFQSVDIKTIKLSPSMDGAMQREQPELQNTKAITV